MKFLHLAALEAIEALPEKAVINNTDKFVEEGTSPGNNYQLTRRTMVASDNFRGNGWALWARMVKVLDS